jgi:hypothetical protein
LGFVLLNFKCLNNPTAVCLSVYSDSLGCHLLILLIGTPEDAQQAEEFWVV